MVDDGMPADDGGWLEYAIDRRDYYAKWRARLWGAHLWLSGLSYVFAVLVPFGLALLLYAPERWRMAINLSTLAGSCLSLVFYGLDQNQRLPDRSLLLKRCEASSQFAIHKYLRSRDEEELARELTDIVGDHVGFDGA